MFYSRLINLWLLFILFLIVLSSISINYFELIIGYVIILILFWCFLLGVRSIKHLKKVKIIYGLKPDINYFSIEILAIIFATVFTPLYINFYTGNSLFIALLNLFEGKSNYIEYQNYFASEELSNLTIGKLPYIIGAGILKYLYLFNLVQIIAFKRKISLYHFTVILLLILLNVTISIARGTSFELFETGIVLIYLLFQRNKLLNIHSQFGLKTKVLLFTSVIILFFVFGFNVDLRGEMDCVTREYCFDKKTFLSINFPSFSKTIFSLSGYFIFGTYFIASVLKFHVLTGINPFLSFLFPKGLLLFNYGSSYSDLICNRNIDCGVAWIPEIIQLITYFGFIGGGVFLFLLGRLSVFLYSRAYNSISYSILLFYVFFYMISLPVGNFISTSSSNVIAIFIAIILSRVNPKQLIEKKIPYVK